jgi:4-amino-4-deoxy-L-arabinose transferase-like glycosyltransferase
MPARSLPISKNRDIFNHKLTNREMPALIRRLHLDKQTVVFFLTIGLLVVGGVWTLAYSTPYGLSLNDDAIAYIAGARSILSGQGYREAWLASNGPVTHFPPGFPAVLALIGYITGLDPVRGARALNGLLFGLNIGLTGWLGWRMTRSRTGGILSALLALLNSSFLYIHTRAMSEPLYIFLMLVSFILLDLYFERQKSYYLILLGILLGWAYLARYAALSLVATMLALMLILHGEWRKRISSFLILAAGSLPWVIAWSIRNRIVGGTLTNRVLGWHPITPANWLLAVETLSSFFIPISQWRRAIPVSIQIVALLLIALVILVWVLYKGLSRLFKPARVSIPEVLPLTNGLHTVAYLLALIVTMTLFDSATKFQDRILSPVYISIILLAVTTGSWLWSNKHRFWKPVIILVTIALLGMHTYGQYQAVPKFQNDPGFASVGWRYSKAIAALKEVPPDVLILTNEPGLVYFHTGRPTGVLPPPDADLTQIKQDILEGKYVIALFRVSRVSDRTLEFYYKFSLGLNRKVYGQTWILSAFPEQENK